MLTSVTGIYRDGKIILTQQPKDLPDDTQVIVTFLRSNVVDLSSYGIDEAQAAELRSRLQSFAAEWDNPEMDIYDDYDTINATR